MALCIIVPRAFSTRLGSGELVGRSCKGAQVFLPASQAPFRSHVLLLITLARFWVSHLRREVFRFGVEGMLLIAVVMGRWPSLRAGHLWPYLVRSKILKPLHSP